MEESEKNASESEHDIFIKDVKLVYGMKNIKFGFTLIQIRVSTVYCENKSPAYFSGWIPTHDPCNSRAVSYQLDCRDCPVARGSSNPIAAGTTTL